MNSMNTKIFPYDNVDLARTFADWNSPILSSEYIYIQVSEELASVKIKLDEKEKEAEFFNTEMKRKWETLKSKQLDFLADVRKYDKFYIENEEKCQRVSEKINKEFKFQTECKNRIVVDEKRIEYLENVIEKMKASVDKLRQYYNFLSCLKCNEDEQGSCVENIINHYTLLNSQTELHDKTKQITVETEDSFHYNERSIKEQHFSIHNQTKDLMYTLRNYERKKDSTALLKSRHDKKLNESKKAAEQNLLMIWSYDNVYRMLVSCKFLTSVKNEFLDKSQKDMLIIKLTEELQRIVSEASGLVRKSNLSCEVYSSFISMKRIF